MKVGESIEFKTGDGLDEIISEAVDLIKWKSMGVCITVVVTRTPAEMVRELEMILHPWKNSPKEELK
jgi:hypothetical protein